jgi:hypothetical protein
MSPYASKLLLLGLLLLGFVALCGYLAVNMTTNAAEAGASIDLDENIQPDSGR